MDTRTVSDYGHLFYDPYIYGYDDEFFKRISGSITGVDGKIRISTDGSGSSGTILTTTMMMFGDLMLKTTVPTAPTGGDSRIWGLYSLAYGSRNAAYFFISGTSFYARTYGDSVDTAESTTIPWVAAWTNKAVKFEIKWRIDKVQFFANGIKLATHYTYIPKQTLLPMYFVNANSDNLDFHYIEITSARKIFSAKPGFYDPSASPSISQSLSPSLSASLSPSISPSLSSSPSISPSLSPSISSSLSSSLSPSYSSSLSPSISSSLSPSLSPSLSSSLSASLSPSISPSLSTSPSISPSVSSSTSTSPSISPSPSP